MFHQRQFHQRQFQLKQLLLLCTLLSPALQKHSVLQHAGLARSMGPAVAYAQATFSTTGTSIKLPLNVEGITQAVESFAGLISNPYDMSSLFGVPEEQLQALGVPEEYITSAQQARKSFRQGLVAAFDGSALENGTLAGNGSALAGNNSSILDSVFRSATPIVLGQDGQPLMPLLTAVGTWLGNQVRQTVEALSGPGQELEGLSDTTRAGRKLLQMDETETPADGGEVIDAVAAAARDIERIKTYLANLAEVADEVFEAEKAAKAAKAAKGADNGSNTSTPEDEFEDVDDDAGDAGSISSASRRRLQQDGDNDPFDGYATAFRFIFSNVFDLFRADGLYGLTPIIADIRGIFRRYNWISDLIQIIQAPFENFVNANLFPLPQSNDDFIALVRRFFSDYCTYEEASNSEQILGSYTGPSFTVELVPVSCPIYADPVTGRSYISFADCDPAELVIAVEPLTITEAYLSAATYTGTECKYTELYGTNFELVVGGGEQVFTVRRSAQGLDIVPTVIQQNAGDLKFFDFEDDEATEPSGNSVTLEVTGDKTVAPNGTVTVVTDDTLTGTVGA